ncbi:hypothetical protein ACT3SQ_16170 [Brachybacterium sp. AOP42-C2-15]|uniref:hypothetical protein n=1 Tax=Brachybacterium sp. AOP42-C2-15 TaxID=3457670 RepID=UPI0040335787
MSAEWPGILDPEVMNENIVEASHRLADAAKAGRWEVVTDLLESGQAQNANQWRFGGTSWFTPLHQAAWLGAPAEVAENLIRLGAWRSLRTADGARAVDLARARGHHHLLEVLAVPEPTERDQQTFAAWDQHLADLIAERTGRLDPAESRPVPTEVIALDRLESLWFPYPGMYGGFSMSIHRDLLIVKSWSRVVDGSGQGHVITESGCELVEEGFV